MSGQPCNKPTDAEKFRREYMANLNLQIKLNQQNYDANILYQKTGVPQQLTDTRSQDAKFQDIHNLKQQANSLLLDLMDGFNAQEVLNNITDDDLIYLVSSFPKIKSILKPKYSLGVPASIFTDFLERYIASEERNLGLDDNNQATSRQILMNTQLILQSIASNQDLSRIEQILLDMSMGSIGLRQSILREIKDLKETLPTTQELKDINNLENEILKEQINGIINDAFSNIPTKDDLKLIMKNLEIAIRAKDSDAVNANLTKLNQLLAISSDVGDDLQIIKQLVQGSQHEVIASVERRAIYIPSSELEKQTKDQIVSYYRRLLEIPDLEQIMLDNKTKTDWTYGSKEKLLILYKSIEEDVKLYTREPLSPVAIPLFTPEKKGKGISGRGLQARETRGRPATRNYIGSTRPARADKITYEDVDWNDGIPVVPRFIPFGRYIINKRRLYDDNVVSLKTRSGGYLQNFKSQKISSNLGRIFKSIVKGDIPTYDDINELTNDERDYLYRVSKASDIQDRVNIPSPNKKQIETDLNKFEIMKGEILSGNDSKELIKNFKILLLQLSNKQLIPPREAKDLLFELTSMGY